MSHDLCDNHHDGLDFLETGRPVEGYKNTAELVKKHRTKTGGVPYFRFPPEPNGFLHIGHAKSMNLNYGNTQKFKGKAYLRFDDTNPESEEQIYIDSIIEMVHWLGWKPDWITYSSDHFDTLHEFAVRLIKKGKAYVDHSTSEQLKKQREERTNSPWRDRPVEESLKLFEHMRQGRFAEGEATLRCKMDMQSDNPNMRDFIAYRVKYTPHPHVGDKWCIYPSYDYTHCLIDSLEDIDYSCCTLEFETRRESYFWLLAELDLYRPHVWEFSRLNVTGALLSKRKINALVWKKLCRGWDDPRLLTLAGLRRRGYTPRAINNFCTEVGVTRTMNVIDVKNLEHHLRADLDETTDRKMGVLDPVKLVITNWAGKQTVQARNHPRDETRGSRDLEFSNELYIDRSDFREVDDNPKYYGLAPGKSVGLKYSGIVTCTGFERGNDGSVAQINCTIEFDRKKEGVKTPKTNISWVSCTGGVKAEMRLYTPLLTDDRAAIEDDFMKYVDPESEKIVHGFVEKSIVGLPVRTSVQLERFAFFTVDQDTTPDNLVLVRVIALKEDKEKK